MNDIISYVKKYKFESFDKKPFNEIDSLVLCQLVYMKFEVVAAALGKDEITLMDVNSSPKRDELFFYEKYRESNTALFEALIESKRFSGLKITNIRTQMLKDRETQFCAMTFVLPYDIVYVAFRGTDETITGWQEDFSLSLRRPNIGQKLAASYLTEAFSQISEKIIVGGHSKGGNLAVFASMNLPLEAQKRIVTIYNHDGPGFRPEIMEKYHYDRIAHLIKKYIPRASIVGLLLELGNDYKVVEASGFGPAQHNPFMWETGEDKFVYTDEMNKGPVVWDGAFNDWMLALDDESAEEFVDVVVELLDGLDAENVMELSLDNLVSFQVFYEKMKKNDPSISEFLSKNWQLFKTATKHKAVETIQADVEETRQWIQGKTQNKKSKKH